MPWEIDFAPEFRQELPLLSTPVQDELFARLELLRQYGPALGRPFVDTLSGAKFRNLKELRFDAAGGVWRFAFAFDPRRRAIVLTGGSKSGTSSRRFYDRLIREAEKRYERWLSIAR